MHLSKRNFPLIYQGSTSVPVITFENYEKWYDVYIVHPDGTVGTVPVRVIEEVNDATKKQLWIDHCFHPMLLLLIAKHYEGCVDIVSLETAAGRWLLEENSIEKEMFTYFLE